MGEGRRLDGVPRGHRQLSRGRDHRVERLDGPVAPAPVTRLHGEAPTVVGDEVPPAVVPGQHAGDVVGVEAGVLIAFEQMSVLVIDDDPDLCAMLKRALEHAGHRVVTANENAIAFVQVAVTVQGPSAEEQIASAESDAVRAVRDRAVRTAVAAASELLAQQVAAGQRSAGIDDAIEDVARRLN